MRECWAARLEPATRASRTAVPSSWGLCTVRHCLESSASYLCELSHKNVCGGCVSRRKCSIFKGLGWKPLCRGPCAGGRASPGNHKDFQVL